MNVELHNGTSRRFAMGATDLAPVVVCLLALVVVAMSAQARTEGPPDVALGAEVYELECAQCHYAGERTPTAPPLINSPVLDKPAVRTARIILAGQDSETVIDGQLFGGIMPAQAYLSDEEIAAVTAYIRKTFGGIHEPAPRIEEVAALRASLESEP